MSKIRLKTLNHLQILLLLLFSFFLSTETAVAQNGLINAMSFEHAEEIAIKSIRRASGIGVKEVKIPDDITNNGLKDLVDKDKYARNCLELSDLIAIQKKAKDAGNIELTPKEIGDYRFKLNDKCVPYRRLRLTDKLEFLGIIDDFKLAALRSYIVRNIEFGVKSIWGLDSNDVAQSFVISGKQLNDVKTSTTVLDLAKKIQSSAALPFLSYSSAESIVRNCRNKVSGEISMPEIAKTVIYADLNTPNDKTKDTVETKVEKFIVCINSDVLKTGDPVTYENEEKYKKKTYENPDGNSGKNPAKSPANLKRYKYGVQSVKIVNNEGDNRFYYLTADFHGKLKANIAPEKWRYKDLIEHLVVSAGIDSSKKFVATSIVINALLEIEVKEVEKKNMSIEQENKNKSVKDETIKSSRELKTFSISERLLLIRSLRCNLPLATKNSVSVENTLDSLCIKTPDALKILTGNIAAESEKSSYLLRNDKKYLVNIEPFEFSDKITSQSTIEEIIKIVEKKVVPKQD